MNWHPAPVMTPASGFSRCRVHGRKGDKLVSAKVCDVCQERKKSTVQVEPTHYLRRKKKVTESKSEADNKNCRAHGGSWPSQHYCTECIAQTYAKRTPEGLIDSVTGLYLDPSWQHPDTMPDPAKVGPYECLVLVGIRRMEQSTKEGKSKRRIHVARFAANVITIGGMMSFDMPPLVAWQPSPNVFKE